MLTFMSEEDSFWALVGIVKGMRNLFSFDCKAGASKIDVYENFCAFTNRRICFKNEMNILKCIIKLHLP